MIQYTDDDLVRLGFKKMIGMERDFLLSDNRVILRLIAHNSPEINACSINVDGCPFLLQGHLVPQTINDIRSLANKFGLSLKNDAPLAWFVTFDWPRMTDDDKADCYRFVCKALGHLITEGVMKPEAKEVMQTMIAQSRLSEGGPWFPMGNHCDVRFNPDDLWPNE